MDDLLLPELMDLVCENCHHSIINHMLPNGYFRSLDGKSLGKCLAYKCECDTHIDKNVIDPRANWKRRFI